MNKLIFRKLSLDILVFFLLSSISITLIIWVIQAVNLLDIISEQGHGIKIYFVYSALNIPKIFSKIIIFTFFLTLFVVLIRYDENNEIIVFWTNGITKISFINFIAKLSIFFVIFQLFLNLLIVPYSQNLGQEYLKNSSSEFFPKLIQEKKFSNVMRNLTIFVENYNDLGELKGIYIKEKISNTENKIIIASKGKLEKNDEGFNFKLFQGEVTTINKKGNYNFGFEETNYNLSKFNSKTRKYKKIDETATYFLFKCFNKFKKIRKEKNIRCGENNSYLLKDIYEEIFKRVVNPIYVVILSLISSLLILKPKSNFFQNNAKFLLFVLGFTIILFSQLSYKFINYSTPIELIFVLLPIISIVIFYTFILIKTKFRLNYL